MQLKKLSNQKIVLLVKDVNENNLRMKLNFGHTFAHAIEVKNNYSKNITHGEGCFIRNDFSNRLSYVKKICSKNTAKEIEEVYFDNNLSYTYKKYLNP